MPNVIVPEPTQYLVDADGQRTGVVLEWEAYQALRASLPADPDLLVGLGKDALQALAEGMVSAGHQARLTGLLQKNREGELSPGETLELDRLLEHVDQMNMLKARALYTLQQLED